MTRINCGIPPEELHYKHLLAEHREIVRIPNQVASGRFSLAGRPEKFKLGTGHVRFFFDKLLYLKKRYEELYAECLRRKFNVTYLGGAWDSVPQKMMNDYTPTEEDRIIVRERIAERIKSFKTK